MALRAGKHSRADRGVRFRIEIPLRRILTPSILIPVCFVALAILWFLPILPFDNRTLPDSGFFDPPGSVWDFAWWRFALDHGLNPFVTHFLDYPPGVNLAGQASAPLLAVLGVPITWWFGPIAALNFFLMVAVAASASAMYFLARFLSVRTFSAAVAGLLYGFG